MLQENHELLESLYGSSPDGFIPALAITEYLKNKHKILIIGDFTKRDHNLLVAQNKDVHVIDIVPLQGIKNFYMQSITQKTPFDNETFDGIILAEVIEHLFQDYVALEEIHRILKPDGTLVITVPYLSNEQDKPEFHVRVHSNKTIRRLLAHCGFEIEDHFFRGLMSRLPQKNKLTKYFIFGIRKLLLLGFGSRGATFFRNGCFLIERSFGSTPWLHFIQKNCTSYGGIMKIRKGKTQDFMKVQKEAFTPQNTSAYHPAP